MTCIKCDKLITGKKNKGLYCKECKFKIKSAGFHKLKELVICFRCKKTFNMNPEKAACSDCYKAIWRLRNRLSQSKKPTPNTTRLNKIKKLAQSVNLIKKVKPIELDPISIKSISRSSGDKLDRLIDDVLKKKRSYIG